METFIRARELDFEFAVRGRTISGRARLVGIFLFRPLRDVISDFSWPPGAFFFSSAPGPPFFLVRSGMSFRTP